MKKQIAFIVWKYRRPEKQSCLELISKNSPTEWVEFPASLMWIAWGVLVFGAHWNLTNVLSSTGLLHFIVHKLLFKHNQAIVLGLIFKNLQNPPQTNFQFQKGSRITSCIEKMQVQMFSIVTEQFLHQFSLQFPFPNI